MYSDRGDEIRIVFFCFTAVEGQYTKIEAVPVCMIVWLYISEYRYALHFISFFIPIYIVSVRSKWPIRWFRHANNSINVQFVNMCGSKKSIMAGAFVSTWTIFVAIMVVYLTPTTDGRICAEIDIRNSPSQFRRLENCTLVEGSVTIALIEKHAYFDFSTLRFPKLR